MKEVSCRILGLVCASAFLYGVYCYFIDIDDLLTIVMWVSILLKVYIALTVFYTSAVKSSTYDQKGWDVPRRI
jgi:hypothetical protein